MPGLQTATLKASIKQAFIDQSNKITNPNDALDNLAEQISAAIHAYVTELQITYTGGLTTASGGGPVTAVPPGMQYTLS